MKKLFALTLIAAAFISFSASAQRPASGGMSLSKKELTDSLKISDAIADSVIAIQKESMTQMRSIMTDQSISQDQKKEKKQALKQDMKTNLKKFLTDEQLQKMKQMEMAKRQQMGAANTGAGSGDQ
jgi:hypothetical protein